MIAVDARRENPTAIILAAFLILLAAANPANAQVWKRWLGRTDGSLPPSGSPFGGAANITTVAALSRGTPEQVPSAVRDANLIVGASSASDSVSLPPPNYVGKPSGVASAAKGSAVDPNVVAAFNRAFVAARTETPIAAPSALKWGRRGSNFSLLRSSSFIVKFRNGTTASDLQTRINTYNANRGFGAARKPISWSAPSTFNRDGSALPSDDNPNQARLEFNRNAFPGVLGTFTVEFIDTIRFNSPDLIEYAEEDSVVVAGAAVQYSPLNWGLQRVSSLDPPNYSTANYYFPNTAGSNVDIWMLDTGIQTNHSEFGGRAQMKANYISTETWDDYNGHGTHTAAIAAGASYGVAKLAKVYGVKVLDKNRAGTYSGVILGLQYVQSQMLSGMRYGRTIVSLSASGPISQALTDAITAARNAGIVVVAAAGNANANACSYSPSNSVGAALIVGASTYADLRASFSNYGSCVSLFGPGSSIRSAYIDPTGSGGTTSSAYMSGTSMATPHVAGVAALWMSDGRYTLPLLGGPNAVYADILYYARPMNDPDLLGSPNKQVYNYCDPDQ